MKRAVTTYPMDFTSIETIVGRTGAMIFILANVLQSHHSS